MLIQKKQWRVQERYFENEIKKMTEKTLSKHLADLSAWQDAMQEDFELRNLGDIYDA